MRSSRRRGDLSLFQSPRRPDCSAPLHRNSHRRTPRCPVRHSPDPFQLLLTLFHQDCRLPRSSARYAIGVPCLLRWRYCPDNHQVCVGPICCRPPHFWSRSRRALRCGPYVSGGDRASADPRCDDVSRFCGVGHLESPELTRTQRYLPAVHHPRHPCCLFVL